MRVLGIIPARGGSKGIPRKNIKLLCGKPLIAYTIDAAARSTRLTRTIVSTEDTEIADVARSLGADVPFLRPRDLADDTTPTLPVVLHAIETLEAEGESYDAVCLLQPTSPLRRPEDIDGCIDLLEASGSDSVISVIPVPEPCNPHWVYMRSADGRMSLSTGETEPIARRQELPPAFHRDGSVYVTRTEVLVNGRSLYGVNVQGYEIPPRYSANIDTQTDWQVIEGLFAVQSGAEDISNQVEGTHHMLAIVEK
jgi:CMP-N-acetylneuraminic acid synthetase